MFRDIFQLLLGSAQGAFFEVTVFVGAALLVFGYINYKKEGKLIDRLKKCSKCQPLVGALLGLTPGCGGAILVMPLFAKRAVSFGTVVAALIATTGDAAYVLLSVDPGAFLIVSSISFVIAVISGYLVDYFGIGDKLSLKLESIKRPSYCKGCSCRKIAHVGHEAGDEVGAILHKRECEDQTTVGYKITHKGYLYYWGFLALGLIVGVLALFEIEMESEAIVLFGIIGTFLSLILMIAGKKYFKDDTHEEEELKLTSLKEMLVHTAEEVAFVGVWVFVAYFTYEMLIYGVGGGDYAAGESVVEGFMLSAGLWSVFVAAVVGMIPGCGPQIILVSLYSKGLLPFVALLAHAISQDGDALFPLIALNKKAALLATVATTVVALVVGGVAFFIL